MMVLQVELQLRSQLIKDALSSVLMEAGFAVFYEQAQPGDSAIVIVDFNDCKDPDFVQVQQSRGVKIVALKCEAESWEIGFDEMAPLSGILTYGLSAVAFVRSLRLICAGERVFPRDLALERRTQAASTRTRSGFNDVHLSPREKEILSYLVSGDSNKAIARCLGITEATVKVHLKSVQRKIRVDNRTQAAIWALAYLAELDTASRGLT
jgi:two-component system, NarL family, nitrate/nitrite response regulator NarL